MARRTTAGGRAGETHTHTHSLSLFYLFIYVCVCVCVAEGMLTASRKHQVDSVLSMVVGVLVHVSWLDRSLGSVLG